MQDLLPALLLAEPQAGEVWKRWRAGIDINELPWLCQQLLPALNPSLPGWLEQDPAAGIFQGIVRMTWTQNQLRLRKAAGLQSALQQAGVTAVMAGPPAWALRIEAPAIRPIPHLTFLVAREDVSKSAAALTSVGWRPYAEPPEGEGLDWSDHISFEQDNVQLYLHWRLLATPPEDALECERAFLSGLATVKWNQQAVRTPSAEASLLHMLCGDRHGDVLPWQADVALAGTAGIDWRAFRKIAQRFAAHAFERLGELSRGSRLPIPTMEADHPGKVRRKIRQFWSQYRALAYYRKQAPTWGGFLQFLTERWNAGSVWQMPLAGAKRALRQRRSLLR